jgi:hypothetical protein
MKIKFLALAALSLIYVSCSDDDSSSNTNDDFAYYTETRTYSLGDDDYKHVSTFNILDDRLITYSDEVFVNGVVDQAHSGNLYVYQNGLLTLANMPNSQRDFYYDNQQRLVGAREVGVGTIYMRYVHNADGVVFVERIDAPYDDPSAEVIQRHIIKLDNSDRVMWAGPDINQDGQADAVNTYQYSGSDVSQVTLANGETVGFSYGAAKDNSNFFRINHTDGPLSIFLMLLCWRRRI